MKNKKKIQIKTQLESHYGIGKIQSKLICNQLGISSNLRNNQITKYERKKIMNYLRKRTRIIVSPAPFFPTEKLGGAISLQSTLSKIGSVSQSWLSNLNKINKSPIVDNLKYIQKNNILDLINKNSYRGFRHKKGLPVRGQRTRTNRQTRRRLARARHSIRRP